MNSLMSSRIAVFSLVLASVLQSCDASQTPQPDPIETPSVPPPGVWELCRNPKGFDGKTMRLSAALLADADKAVLNEINCNVRLKISNSASRANQQKMQRVLSRAVQAGEEPREFNVTAVGKIDLVKRGGVSELWIETQSLQEANYWVLAAPNGEQVTCGILDERDLTVAARILLVQWCVEACEQNGLKMIETPVESSMTADFAFSRHEHSLAMRYVPKRCQPYSHPFVHDPFYGPEPKDTTQNCFGLYKDGICRSTR